MTGFCAIAQTDTSGSHRRYTDTVQGQHPAAIQKEVLRTVVRDTAFRRMITDYIRVADSIKNPIHCIVQIRILLMQVFKANIKLLLHLLTIKKPIDSFYLKLLDNPFLRTTEKPIYLVINERERTV